MLRNSVKRARDASGRARVSHLDQNDYADCFICRFACSVVLEAHHIHPLNESRGANGLLSLICPNCHAIVHKYTQLFYLKRTFTDRQLVERDLLWEYVDTLPIDVQERLISIVERRIQ